MASRDLADLHPDLQPVCQEWLRRCEAAGLTVLITCTYRSEAEQAVLYAQGRTRPGPVLTRARPGESAHNGLLQGRPAARAFDFCLLRHGKPVWETHGEAGRDWQRAGQIGEALGLRWYGAADAPFREFAHLQLRGGEHAAG